MIGAIGQNTINFLTTPNKETRDNLKKNTKSTSDLVQNLVSNKGTSPRMQSYFEAIKKVSGEYKGFEVLGTYPVSEVSKLSSTYIKLNFENGNKIIRFVRRRNNSPYPLTGTPVPALTPIMPQKKNTFIAYYPVLKKSVSIKFHVGKNKRITSLSLTNADHTLSAQKMGALPEKH